jgi:formylmethanofuran dehydrogenase subunit E
MSTSGKVEIPQGVWDFHGHICPFMPIGYRMGQVAMRELGVSHIGDHGAFGLSEMGVGHPQTCMIDGFMSVTGCTYGKLMMERLNYGKVACLLGVPGKGAVRVYMKSEFQDALGKQEFFVYRKKGIEPSQVPADIVKKVVDMVLTAPESEMFVGHKTAGLHLQSPERLLCKD